MNKNHWNIKKEYYHGQVRYKGDIHVPESMAFLIKVHDQNGFNYTKVPKSNILVHEVDCLFHPVLNDGIQVILRIDQSVNSNTTWHNKTFEFHEHGILVEGYPFTLAHFNSGQPAIDILGISATKLRNLRNGIWRVREQYIESIPEPNKEILMKSRHGYVRADTPKKNNKKEVIKILTTLTPREEKILKIRLNIEPDKHKALEQVGKDFNITRKRIQEIEKKALKKLRGDFPDDAA